MNSYKALTKQIYVDGNFKLVPIRYEDRLAIMQWRNEQIYHLRQNIPLTLKDQDNYFDTVVSELFDQTKPNQLLFSFLKDDICIGYGGLVHINWIDKNAEISFVLKTSLEKDFFVSYWSVFLGLIELVAFAELALHKIFTFAFDLRPKLYEVLEKAGYCEEARLKEHCCFDERYVDVIISAKIFPQGHLNMRFVNEDDSQALLRWANDIMVRKNAFNSNPINSEAHTVWFKEKLGSPYSMIFIISMKNQPFGQVRLDYESGFWLIDYSIDEQFRGKGYGSKMLELVLQFCIFKQVKAVVKTENIASRKVFLKLGFQESNKGDLIEYKYQS